MNRIRREKETLARMIALYCRHREHPGPLCSECRQLLEFALRRLDACRYGNNKSSCRKCPTHCYAPAYRTKIREVMCYAGPRMLFYHPLAAIRHLTGR